MLNTTLLSPRILAVGYNFFRFCGVDQWASSASLYQDFSCSAQSLCLSQKTFNVFLAITLTLQI